MVRSMRAYCNQPVEVPMTQRWQNANPINEILSDLGHNPDERMPQGAYLLACLPKVHEPHVLHHRHLSDKDISYLGEAEFFARRSKDPSSKVGAVILDANLSVRAQGWNGAARGVKADEDCRFTRPEKYKWAVHAEQNAIANAARVGIPLDGCTMVVTHPPCMVCAKLIVQVGIKKVITFAPADDFAERWHGDLVRTRLLFSEAGVTVFYVAKEKE